MASEPQVRAAKQRHAPELLMRPGVSGVGVEKDSSGQYVLSVHLDSTDPSLQQQIPAQIDGIPVKIHADGPFRKFAH